MGKRKRRADRNKTPPSPAFTSHTSQMESSLKEKSSHSFGSTSAKSTSSTHTNNVERSHHTGAHHRHHNHNVNRALLSRAPRHYYSIQHSQRNAANHSGTSTSHGKITLRNDKYSRKLGHKPPESLFSPGTITDAQQWLNRTVIIDAVSCGVMNMRCGLCQKTTIDYSVVGVLVCGHVYHADCLEERTRSGDRSDPPCPLCTSSVVGKRVGVEMH